MKSPRRGRVERTRLGLHATFVFCVVVGALFGAGPSFAKGDYRIDQGSGARYDREDPAMGVPDQPSSGSPGRGFEKRIPSGDRRLVARGGQVPFLLAIRGKVILVRLRTTR